MVPLQRPDASSPCWLLLYITYPGSAKKLEVRLWHQKGIILDEKSQFTVKLHNNEK